MENRRDGGRTIDTHQSTRRTHAEPSAERFQASNVRGSNLPQSKTRIPAMIFFSMKGAYA